MEGKQDLTKATFNIDALQDFINEVESYDPTGVYDGDGIDGKIEQIVHQWQVNHVDDVVSLLQDKANINERLALISKLNKFNEIYNQLLGIKMQQPFNKAIEQQCLDIMTKVVRGHYVSNKELLFYCKNIKNCNVETFNSICNFKNFLTNNSNVPFKSAIETFSSITNPSICIN
jgi:hypothetical protein